MKVTRHLLVVAIFASALLGHNPAKAQGLSFGFNVNQSSLDYGFGLNVSSPVIAQSFQFRLSGSILGLTGVRRGDSLGRVFGYSSVRLGVVGKPLLTSASMHVYLEGGPLILFNSADVSTRSFNIGGYGVLGMEYQCWDRFWLFLEGGGIGTGAEADRLAGNLHYASGLFFGLGGRLMLLP